MQYEKKIAKKAINVFKGISLKVEIEEIITKSQTGYVHILTPRFYRNSHKSPDDKMDPQTIDNESDNPLARQTLEIVVGHLRTDPELKEIIEDNKVRITNPTRPKETDNFYTSQFIITRRL